MNKLYYTKCLIDVCFLADEKSDQRSLHWLAEKYLTEETKKTLPLEIKEVTSKDDVPFHWYHSVYWGQPEDKRETVLEYLKDPEYIEYMRLKKKFDK